MTWLITILSAAFVIVAFRMYTQWIYGMGYDSGIADEKMKAEAKAKEPSDEDAAETADNEIRHD